MVQLNSFKKQTTGSGLKKKDATLETREVETC